ncbi:hypothetical protein [Streptomyces sp. NPDC096013]
MRATPAVWARRRSDSEDTLAKTTPTAAHSATSSPASAQVTPP